MNTKDVGEPETHLEFFLVFTEPAGFLFFFLLLGWLVCKVRVVKYDTIHRHFTEDRKKGKGQPKSKAHLAEQSPGRSGTGVGLGSAVGECSGTEMQLGVETRMELDHSGIEASGTRGRGHFRVAGNLRSVDRHRHRRPSSMPRNAGVTPGVQSPLTSVDYDWLRCK